MVAIFIVKREGSGSYGESIFSWSWTWRSRINNVKGLKAIKEADVILYDRLVNKEILNYASPSTKFYCGKDPHRHSLPQEETNKMMVTLAKKGT